VNSKLENTQSS